MAIYFYSTREKFGCFSNFSPHGFELDGKFWKTSEHYFQAMKFVGSAHEEAIRLASSPKDAAVLGRSRTFPLRADWEQVKDQIMKNGVLAKFGSHADIRAVLLGTGEEEIVENAPGDAYWGCGADGKGKNMLGKILVEVRTELRNTETHSGSGTVA
jgi:ribA/ribD-fused uncharacterized protein